MNLLSRLFSKNLSSPVADFVLYRSRAGESETALLLLSYEWYEQFENEEWRLCVKRFLHELAKRGYEINEIASPTFTPGEDFVEIDFLVAGIRTTFKCDYLLSLIEITSEDSRAIRCVWDEIGNKVGWAS